MRPVTKGLISILYITIDRYPSCVENLNENLRKTAVLDSEYEILWADNGSNDIGMLDRTIGRHPRLSYARINETNEGVARTINQLILRSRGEFVVQLGNDYDMPMFWLQELVAYAKTIPKTGMVGMAWNPKHRTGKLVAENDDAYPAYHADINKPIFGVKLMTREMLETVGAFDENFHPYGMEDTDYHQRACLAGFRNYYTPALSHHLGNDGGSLSPYRLMKNESLKKAQEYYSTKWSRERVSLEEIIYHPWPEEREPLKAL